MPKLVGSLSANAQSSLFPSRERPWSDHPQFVDILIPGVETNGQYIFSQGMKHLTGASLARWLEGGETCDYYDRAVFRLTNSN